jgi:ribosome-binding factor A
MKRADRVADLVLAEVSDILLKQIRDPQAKRVTITGVKMTDDLRSANIFFVPIGNDESRDEAKDGLQRASGFLRRELGKRLQLRYVPKINFVFDKSFEYGDRIDRLLLKINEKIIC